MIYSLFYYIAFASMRCMTSPTHESSTINHFMESLELYSSTSMDHLMDTLSKTVFQEDLSSPYHLLAAKTELYDSLEGDLMDPLIQNFAMRAGSVLDQARLNKNADQLALAEQVSRQLTAEWQSMAKVQVDAWSQKDLNAFMDKHAGVLQEMIRIPYSGKTQNNQERFQEARVGKRGNPPAFPEELIAALTEIFKNGSGQEFMDRFFYAMNNDNGEITNEQLLYVLKNFKFNDAEVRQTSKGRWDWVSRTSKALYRNQPFTKERLTRLLDIQSHWAALISYKQAATHGFVEMTHGMVDYLKNFSPRSLPRDLNTAMAYAGASFLRGVKALGRVFGGQILYNVLGEKVVTDYARKFMKLHLDTILYATASDLLRENPPRRRVARDLKEDVPATTGEHAGANPGTNFAQADVIAKTAGGSVTRFLKPILFITIPLTIIALVYTMLLK